VELLLTWGIIVIKCTCKKLALLFSKKIIWLHEEPSDIAQEQKALTKNTCLLRNQMLPAKFGPILVSKVTGMDLLIQLRWRSQYVATATRLTDWCFCLRP